MLVVVLWLVFAAVVLLFVFTAAVLFVFFNGFPSALNLYYVIYNLLNYLQQQKKDSGPSFVSKIKEFFQNQKK